MAEPIPTGEELEKILRKAQDLAIMVPREGWDIRKKSLDNMAIDLAELITPAVFTAARSLESVKAELAEVKAQNADWIKENGPGGWIDDLRSSRDRLARALENIEQALEDAPVGHKIAAVSRAIATAKETK